jgi:SsrA-binding protein
MKSKQKSELKIVNRKASYNYAFIESYVAGAVLLGSEVKSVRANKVSLTDAFCYFHNGELFLKNMQLTPSDVNYTHDPMRVKKLLLNKKELRKLERDLIKGTTIIVREVFTVNGRIKIGIALAKGKKDYDKRESLKDKDSKRDMDKQLKNY